MKLTLLLLHFFVCHISLAQEISVSDFVKYELAYDYILSDTNLEIKNVYVSDSIYDLPRIFFVHDVDSFPKVKKRVSSLMKYSESDPPFHTKIVKEQNPNVENILFLSSIKENTLMAALELKRFNIHEFSFSKARGEKSYFYLFVFNEMNEIEHIFNYEMMYENILNGNTKEKIPFHFKKSSFPIVNN